MVSEDYGYDHDYEEERREKENEVILSMSQDYQASKNEEERWIRYKYLLTKLELAFCSLCKKYQRGACEIIKRENAPPPLNEIGAQWGVVSLLNYQEDAEALKRARVELDRRMLNCLKRRFYLEIVKGYRCFNREGGRGLGDKVRTNDLQS